MTGISKSQADKIGEALRNSGMTADLLERLSAYREQLVHQAKPASEAIRSLTLYPVTPREGKSTNSIVAKLRRQKVSLSRMQDIVGCRIVVDSLIEQEALTLRLAGRFSDARLVDRRITPSHGYRAVHFILRWQDNPYEVQVRTRLQHAWAQAVERLSDRVVPGLKYGAVDGRIAMTVQSLSDLIARFEELELQVFMNRAIPEIIERAVENQRLHSGILEAVDMLVSENLR